MRTQLVRAGLLSAGGLLLLLGWVVLGRRAADDLRGTDRNALTFGDIECTPAPPFSRADFLGEVQYLSNLPDRLTLSDDGLAARVAAAFAAHPMVESVEQVQVLHGHVHVSLAYRYAVLVVSGPWFLRPVDGKGMLLPQSAMCEGLPCLEGTTFIPPAGVAGTLWGDQRVADAASVAAYLRPYRRTVAVEKITVEADEVLLFTSGTRFRWGRPPGREQRGEPGADAKSLRFRQLVGKKQALTEREYDLTIPASTNARR